MVYFGYAVYLVGLFIAVTWVMGIRFKTFCGTSLMRQTVNSTMLFFVALAVVPSMSLSPLHLIWMFPAAWLVGILSLAFPFSLLNIPGELFFQLACVGLDREQASLNKERLEKLKTLAAEEGLTPQEALEKLTERGGVDIPKPKAPTRTMLDEVQEVGGKLIVTGYRSLASQNGCAPTSKTSDGQIIEIYKKVGTAFREVANKRGEQLSAGTLNFIVLKFLQVSEMLGTEMVDQHLEYETQKYLEEGLRPDYRKDLELF